MIEAHRLTPVGLPGAGRWKCSCGRWQEKTPASGPYGHTTMKARMSRLNLNHQSHVKYEQRQKK